MCDTDRYWYLLLLVICYKETCVLSLLLLSTTVMLSMTNASTYIGTNVPFQIGYYIWSILITMSDFWMPTDRYWYLLLLVICYKETCVLSLLLLSTTVTFSMTNASTYIGTNVPFQIGYYIWSILITMSDFWMPTYWYYCCLLYVIKKHVWCYWLLTKME